MILRAFTNDREEIVRAISLLREPDTVIELRALSVPKGGIVSGYFDGDNREVLIQAATEFCGKTSVGT